MTEDWIWNCGQQGSELTLAEREREYQRIVPLCRLLKTAELRIVRATLGDLVLNAQTSRELLALRGRLVHQEILRRDNAPFSWLDELLNTAGPWKRRKIIAALTSQPQSSAVVKGS